MPSQAERRRESLFRALADPNRRKLLKLLKRGSRTAGELAEAFPITKGSLSHHFNVLKAADLVRAERRGQQIVYSLNTSVFEDVAAMLLDLFGIEKPEPERDDDGDDGSDRNETSHRAGAGGAKAEARRGARSRRS